MHTDWPAAVEKKNLLRRKPGEREREREICARKKGYVMSEKSEMKK